MSCKQANRPRGIGELASAINLLGDHLVLYRSPLDRVNTSIEDAPERFAGVKVDAKLLGNINQTKPYKKINDAFARSEDLSYCRTKNK
jgi:hypothetical protein